MIDVDTTSEDSYLVYSLYYEPCDGYYQEETYYNDGYEMKYDIVDYDYSDEMCVLNHYALNPLYYESYYDECSNFFFEDNHDYYDTDYVVTDVEEYYYDIYKSSDELYSESYTTYYTDEDSYVAYYNYATPVEETYYELENGYYDKYCDNMDVNTACVENYYDLYDSGIDEAGCYYSYYEAPWATYNTQELECIYDDNYYDSYVVNGDDEDELYQVYYATCDGYYVESYDSETEEYVQNYYDYYNMGCNSAESESQESNCWEIYADPTAAVYHGYNVYNSEWGTTTYTFNEPIDCGNTYSVDSLNYIFNQAYDHCTGIATTYALEDLTTEEGVDNYSEKWISYDNQNIYSVDAYFNDVVATVTEEVTVDGISVIFMQQEWDVANNCNYKSYDVINEVVIDYYNDYYDTGFAVDANIGTYSAWEYYNDCLEVNENGWTYYSN